MLSVDSLHAASLITLQDSMRLTMQLPDDYEASR